jgi:hypothetical protein
MSLSDKNSHNSSEEMPSKKEKVVMNDPNDLEFKGSYEAG